MGALTHIRSDGGLRGTDIITCTIPEFRRLTGVSRSKIYEMLAAGDIESVHIGARRLIIIQSYLALIERQRSPKVDAR